MNQGFHQASSTKRRNRMTLPYSFDDNNEEWTVYDYEASVAFGSSNVCYPMNWESAGGVNDFGFVRADDSQYTIDTPEQPCSILSLIYYRRWIGEDALDLKGANTYFWVNKPGTRWHLTSQPLNVEQGRWTDKPNSFVLSLSF